MALTLASSFSFPVTLNVTSLFSVFFLTVLVNLPLLSSLFPLKRLSPNPLRSCLLIVSVTLSPIFFSSHSAHFHLHPHLLNCSGPVGPQRGSEHLRAAQAHQQQSAAVRSRRHQLPDVHLRWPGAGAQRPGQRAALRRHVSQLAAQRLRHVRMRSVSHLRWKIINFWHIWTKF